MRNTQILVFIALFSCACVSHPRSDQSTVWARVPLRQKIANPLGSLKEDNQIYSYHKIRISQSLTNPYALKIRGSDGFHVMRVVGITASGRCEYVNLLDESNYAVFSTSSGVREPYVMLQCFLADIPDDRKQVRSYRDYRVSRENIYRLSENPETWAAEIVLDHQVRDTLRSVMKGPFPVETSVPIQRTWRSTRFLSKPHGINQGVSSFHWRTHRSQRNCELSQFRSNFCLPPGFNR